MVRLASGSTRVGDMDDPKSGAIVPNPIQTDRGLGMLVVGARRRKLAARA